MRRRVTGEYTVRRRGGSSFRHPRRLSPRRRERSRESHSYSPVRQEHRPRQFVEGRHHFNSEISNQAHSSLDQFESGYVESNPHPLPQHVQHPSHPQLSSNRILDLYFIMGVK